MLPFFFFISNYKATSEFFLCARQQCQSFVLAIYLFVLVEGEERVAEYWQSVVCSQQLSLLSITWFSFIKGNMGSLAFIVPKKGWLVIIDFI